MRHQRGTSEAPVRRHCVQNAVSWNCETGKLQCHAKALHQGNQRRSLQQFCVTASALQQILPPRKNRRREGNVRHGRHVCEENCHTGHEGRRSTARPRQGRSELCLVMCLVKPEGHFQEKGIDAKDTDTKTHTENRNKKAGIDTKNHPPIQSRASTRRQASTRRPSTRSTGIDTKGVRQEEGHRHSEGHRQQGP